MAGKQNSIIFKGELTNVDKVQKVAYGWAYVSTKKGVIQTDHSGDTWDITEVEKTAHDFVCECRVGGESHIYKGGAELVESLVFSETIQKMLGIDLGMEGWLVGFRITDEELLEKVEKGDYAMFSIGGSGIREEED
jgi:hypothetical protein